MADKKTALSIVIRTVDNATASLRRINARIEAATKPVRDFRESLSSLRKASGIDSVIEGFAGVGNAILDVVGKVAVLGGAIAAATAGVVSMIGEFDDLGDKAERMNIGADAIQEWRWAAEKSGASIEKLDAGIEKLVANIGLARANKGPLVEFLGAVSPSLLKQIKAAKDTEEALNLLAGAAAKLTDPAKRAAFAQKTMGDVQLGPLLTRGAEGVRVLREQYRGLAGPQEQAVAKAAEFGDAMDELKAAIQGVKASVVEGIAPALKELVDRIKRFVVANRQQIRQWASDLGEKIPGAAARIVDAINTIVSSAKPFVDSMGKLKVIAFGLAAVISGPLVASFVKLGIAMMANPVGLIIGIFAGVAAATAGLTYVITKKWKVIAGFFAGLWDGIKNVFAAAWDFIKGIVDKIGNAVGKVVGAVGKVSNFAGRVRSMFKSDIASDRLGKNPDWVQKALAKNDLTARAGAAVTPAQQAKITVDFANAPKGTRVQTDPRSTADVDMSVGYQMLGAM